MSQLERLIQEEIEQAHLLRERYEEEHQNKRDPRLGRIGKYLLFAGSDYYPSGGASDFKGCYDSVEEAKHAFDGIGINDEETDWAHIAEQKDNALTLVLVGESVWRDRQYHWTWREGEDWEQPSPVKKGTAD